MIDDDRYRISWHNFCLWKEVEVEYLQKFSAVFRKAVHAPPELKLSFLSMCAMRMILFFVPHENIEIGSNCF